MQRYYKDLRLRPRHIEIMQRLAIGYKQSEIAKDMLIPTPQLNLIIASPLFQLEYRRLMADRMARLEEIQDEIINAGVEAVKLQKEIITDKVPNCFVVPVELRARVANEVVDTIKNMLLPLRAKPTNGGVTSADDETQPYEKRLEEVIVRREVTTYKQDELKEPEIHVFSNDSIPNDNFVELPNDNFVELPLMDSEGGLEST